METATAKQATVDKVDECYHAHVRRKIEAYRTALSGSGLSLPYVNYGTVDAKTTEALKLVEQARALLAMASQELAPRGRVG
jgi:hypothetical protein